MDSPTWVSTNSMQWFSEKSVCDLLFTITETLTIIIVLFFSLIRLCKGVLELLWEDISNSVFPVSEAFKIRKNILLYKLRHGLNDSTIASVRNLNQLRSKSNILKTQISSLEEEYEEQDYNVRQKSKNNYWFQEYFGVILIRFVKFLVQRLKDIKNKCSMISTRKDFLKLKHSETSEQLKDCSDMRRICQHLMPNTSKDINQQKLRENLDIVAELRSAENKKQVYKISYKIIFIHIDKMASLMY